MVLRARFRSAPALVMAPPAETTGVPSIYGDDGDSRGVWGSTRELHLRVGAHLRESRAARSDERYKTFVAYARRREEEREDAPDRDAAGNRAERAEARRRRPRTRATARDPGGGTRKRRRRRRSGRWPSFAKQKRAERVRPIPGRARRARPAHARGRRVQAGRGGGRGRGRAAGPARAAHRPKPEPRGDGGGGRESREARARAPDAFWRRRRRLPRTPRCSCSKRWRRRRGTWASSGRASGRRWGNPTPWRGPDRTPPANPRAAFPRRARHPDEVADAWRGAGGARRDPDPRGATGTTMTNAMRNANLANLARRVRFPASRGSRRLMPFEPRRERTTGDAPERRAFLVARVRHERRALLPGGLASGGAGRGRLLRRARGVPRAEIRGRFDRGALEASAARVRRAKFAGRVTSARGGVFITRLCSTVDFIARYST